MNQGIGFLTFIGFFIFQNSIGNKSNVFLQNDERQHFKYDTQECDNRLPTECEKLMGECDNYQFENCDSGVQHLCL